MSSPREAQLPLLLSISEGLSRGTGEMLRVSPQGDAIHPPSCSLAIRESVEEIKWLRAEAERLTRERDEARAEVERLREALKIAAGYVNSCYHEWYRPNDLAEALRDLTKIREALNDERAGELEAKP